MSERADPRGAFDAALIPGMRRRLDEGYARLRAIESAALSAVGNEVKAAFLERCCPGCDGRPDAARAAIRAHGMELIECQSCGLTYSRQVTMRDSEAVREWRSKIDRAMVQLHTSRPYRQLEAARASYYLSEIERLVPGRGRLFEIGCGTGAFLVEAAARRWSALGSEPSDVMCAAACERGVRVTSAPFPNCLQNLPCKFDVIAALDVLEHVVEPIPFLCGIRDRLSPQGLCVLQVPNWESLLVQLQGAASSVICPGHWTYFSPTTLVDLAWNAGLQVKRIETVVSEWDRISEYPRHEIEKQAQRLRPSADLVDLGPRRLLELDLGYKIFAIFGCREVQPSASDPRASRCQKRCTVG